MTAFPGCIQLLLTIFSKVQIVTSDAHVHCMWESGLFSHFCSEAGCKGNIPSIAGTAIFQKLLHSSHIWAEKKKTTEWNAANKQGVGSWRSCCEPSRFINPIWWLRGAQGGCQLLPTTQPHRLHQPSRYAHSRGLSFHTLGANRGVTHSHWAQGGNGTSCLYCGYRQWLSGLSTTSTIEALTLQIKAFYCY